MQISAALVKELRERTGAGMMECKKALTETQGDIEGAIELMRKSGQAKADKKAGRVAAEGRIEIAVQGSDAVIIEVNSETDFVAKDDSFRQFAAACAQAALASAASDVASLMAVEVDGQSLEARRAALIAKIGENIQVRRFERVHSAGPLGAYLHGNRIGVLVSLSGGDEELAKDVAMHIAASRPVCVDADQVPAETVEKEREIFRAQALDSGKPADIVEKMVDGRIRKFLGEITLVGQPFVKNPDQTVGQLLKDRGATATGFVRYEVGEGIEKKVENFAEEVMAQARGA
ncbi:Translation elongation factor Ts [Thioalkalivibrio nitratireducens DSM 14787]|uniref:Elongation factor Ts n=1 Tax=Thioalkalivibrio nitratireducens (strain DSM 14787 / UNIQEM 213 / ALEN2) TaxID=1255043 RepID=L0DXA0_THIND|nr:translation elongation factor Ts [Thioalkalivibrio nitratireducens]AGA33632.1 Translation elongation factor Ts [Thioalkalivibrio nitratireducens DSM 14787]